MDKGKDGCSVLGRQKKGVNARHWLGGEGDAGDGRAEGRVKLESVGRERADQEELEVELL